MLIVALGLCYFWISDPSHCTQLSDDLSTSCCDPLGKTRFHCHLQQWFSFSPCILCPFSPPPLPFPLSFPCSLVFESWAFFLNGQSCPQTEKALALLSIVSGF